MRRLSPANRCQGASLPDIHWWSPTRSLFKAQRNGRKVVTMQLVANSFESGARSASMYVSSLSPFTPSARSRCHQGSAHDLYWSNGDGGPQLDTDERGPDLTNLHSTIVRISVPSGTGAGDVGYTIPTGNREGGKSSELEIEGRNTRSSRS